MRSSTCWAPTISQKNNTFHICGFRTCGTPTSKTVEKTGCRTPTPRIQTHVHSDTSGSISLCRRCPIPISLIIRTPFVTATSCPRVVAGFGISSINLGQNGGNKEASQNSKGACNLRMSVDLVQTCSSEFACKGLQFRKGSEKQYLILRL